MAAIDYVDRRRMRLDVEFHFAASHRLPRYEGPCFRLHGHNYKFFVAIEGEVDPRSGMIADFGDIKRVVGEQVLSRVDHRDLNEVLEPGLRDPPRGVGEVLRAADMGREPDGVEEPGDAVRRPCGGGSAPSRADEPPRANGHPAPGR